MPETLEQRLRLFAVFWVPVLFILRGRGFSLLAPVKTIDKIPLF